MEVAPGIRVSTLGIPGMVYVIDGREFGVDDIGEQGRLVLIHPDDWDRLPKAEREQLADDLTRDSAAAGIRRLEQWLRREYGD